MYLQSRRDPLTPEIRERTMDEEPPRKPSDKLRDVCALADRLGCSFGQLAIAWSLKNESVQCLLLGASNIEQLYESLQSLQVCYILILKGDSSINNSLVYGKIMLNCYWKFKYIIKIGKHVGLFFFVKLFKFLHFYNFFSS